MAKKIGIRHIDAPEICHICGQYLIRPCLETSGSDQFDKGKFCSMHCVNEYFGPEKIKNGEIQFADEE